MARSRSIRSRLLIATLLLGVAGCVLMVIVPNTPLTPYIPTIGRSGADATVSVPDWLAKKIAGLVNNNLRPQLEFSSLAFEPPFAITLTDASLVTPEGERIIEVGTLGIRLAERPAKNRPLRIAAVSFDDGVVRLIVRPGEGLAGFSRMRPDPKKGGKSGPTPGEGGGMRFSDVIEIERVDLSGFSLEFCPEYGGPIRIDGITASMGLSPDPAQPGWYAIDLASGRSPGLEVGLAGRLNFDTLAAEAASLSAIIDAGPATISTLPSSIASILEAHEVTGRLSVRGSASGDLRDPAGASASLTLTGEGVNAAMGQYRLPIDRLDADAAFNAGELALRSLNADLYGGRVSVSGGASLSKTGGPFAVSWSISSVDLERILRSAPSDGAPPKIAGMLTGNGTVEAELSSPRATISGGGNASVTAGRLFMLPGLTRLSKLVNATGFKKDTASNHRGSAVFSLGPDGATITESEFVTNAVAGRGTGLVGFDRTLDLRINAGPLEKIQSLFGLIGDAIGSLTDRLLKYTIKGTFSDPKVGVAPLGID